MTTAAVTDPTPVPVTGDPAAGGVRLLALALGPVLTWVLLEVAAARAVYPDTFAFYGAVVAVLVWSPLPLSVPAVLLDQERAQALPGRSGLVRSVGVLPWLLFRSPAQRLVAGSLAGWGALVALVVAF